MSRFGDKQKKKRHATEKFDTSKKCIQAAAPNPLNVYILWKKKVIS